MIKIDFNVNAVKASTYKKRCSRNSSRVTGFYF